jgi:stalled ribosome rescue protein Dom34
MLDQCRQRLFVCEQSRSALPSEDTFMPTHAVIWIDHSEARIFHVHPEATDETTVLAPRHHVHRHPKGRGEEREHPDDMPRFFSEVARTLDGVDAILIVGPSSAKLEFFRYVHKHERQLESRVVGIETADHPTDGQIVAHAKSYFKASDRLG